MVLVVLAGYFGSETIFSEEEGIRTLLLWSFGPDET